MTKIKISAIFGPVIIIPIIFMLMSCASMENRPLLVRLSIEQATLRFIDHSTDPTRRAQRLYAAVLVGETYLLQNPVASFEAFMTEFARELRKDEMPMADVHLIDSLLQIINSELVAIQQEKPIRIGDDYRDAMLTMVGYVKAMSAMYLDSPAVKGMAVRES